MSMAKSVERKDEEEARLQAEGNPDYFLDEGQSESLYELLKKTDAENARLREEVMRLGGLADELREVAATKHAKIAELRGEQSAIRDMAASEADDLRQEVAAKETRIAELEEALEDARIRLVLEVAGAIAADEYRMPNLCLLCPDEIAHCLELAMGAMGKPWTERLCLAARALLPDSGKEAEHARDSTAK